MSNNYNEKNARFITLSELESRKPPAKEVSPQASIRSGRLHDPSDDVVAVPLTDAQSKALKLQADCAGIATLEPTQARHVAGQAVMVNKKLQMMLALAVQVDERGVDAAIHCLTFHLRYPKGA